MNKIRLFSLVGAAALLLAACGQAAPTVAPTAAPNPTEAPPAPKPTDQPGAIALAPAQSGQTARPRLGMA